MFLSSGGLEAVVGNPPFLGGTKISEPMGSDFRNYIAQHIAHQKTDRADLAVFFLLRAHTLGAVNSCSGFIATNSIAEAGSREVGLATLLRSGASIYRTVPSRRWPGTAVVYVSLLWFRNGEWEGRFIVDDQPAHRISAFLIGEGSTQEEPRQLRTNKGLAAVGSKPAAEGFILSIDEAMKLLDRGQHLADVVKPYLSGDDVASSPNISASRYCVFFGTKSIQQCRPYPEALSIVAARVRPQREGSKNTEPRLRERWWQFGRPAVRIYEEAMGLSRLISVPYTSKYGVFSFVSKNCVYSDSLVLILKDTEYDFGVLNSSFHWWWWSKYGSKMKTDPRYVPSSCFDTFCYPAGSKNITQIGKALDAHRQEAMRERWEGLTKIYNRVHDPDEHAEDIAELRQLHVDLDHAVAAAYGWDDLPIDHDFYDARQGVRYTLGPATRTELLDRLLKLNHERAAAEAAAGLTRQRRGGARRRRAAEGQTSLEAL